MEAQIESAEQVYHPNHVPKSEGSGLFCYRDAMRPCGPDCVAYLAQKPVGVYYEGEQWAHCHLLVNEDRKGRHLVILVDLLQKDVTLRRQAHAEATRGQKAPGAT